MGSAIFTVVGDEVVWYVGRWFTCVVLRRTGITSVSVAKSFSGCFVSDALVDDIIVVR